MYCKGVHQGPILQLFLFNILINGIFHFIKHFKFNYAEDKIVSFSNPVLENVVYKHSEH